MWKAIWIVKSSFIRGHQIVKNWILKIDTENSVILLTLLICLENHFIEAWLAYKKSYLLVAYNLMSLKLSLQI